MSGLFVKLGLHVTDGFFELGTFLGHPLVVLAGHVSDPCISDSLEVISSLADGSLSLLGRLHILLLLKSFERCGCVLEPSVDNLGVEAIAHQIISLLLHFLLEMVSDGVGWLFPFTLFIVVIRGIIVHFRLEGVVLVVQSIGGGAESVKAENLAIMVGLSLNASENVLNLRVFVVEGLAIDKSVLGHPGDDLLVVFSTHLHATDGQIFDLGKEIVVWLGDSTLVILVSLNELHVMSSRLSHFTFEPGLDSGIVGISHGDSGLLWPNELELAIFVFLEELLGKSGLGLRDVFSSEIGLKFRFKFWATLALSQPGEFTTAICGIKLGKGCRDNKSCSEVLHLGTRIVKECLLYTI